MLAIPCCWGMLFLGFRPALFNVPVLGDLPLLIQKAGIQLPPLRSIDLIISAGGRDKHETNGLSALKSKVSHGHFG